MREYRKLWFLLIAVLAVTFALLGFYGREVYRQAPPIPDRFVTDAGETLFTKSDVLDGQTAWQSVGGMELGSIWGHGAYEGPDWSADWLHRVAVAILDGWAVEEGAYSYAALAPDQQAALQNRLQRAE